MLEIKFEHNSKTYCKQDKFILYLLLMQTELIINRFRMNYMYLIPDCFFM